jgi:hypothetical protein
MQTTPADGTYIFMPPRSLALVRTLVCGGMSALEGATLVLAHAAMEHEGAWPGMAPKTGRQQIALVVIAVRAYGYILRARSELTGFPGLLHSALCRRSHMQVRTHSYLGHTCQLDTCAGLCTIRIS